jgi:hypothetical protein
MRRLPDSAQVRGFANTPGLIGQLEQLEAEYGLAVRLGKPILRQAEALGFARQLGSDRIRTWVTGRILPGDGHLSELLESVAPIERPLSELLPAGVLAAYDLGARPDPVLAAVAPFLQEAAPGVYEWISARFQDLRSAYGLDPQAHLFPHLGRGLTLALLPSDGGQGDWPLPRPLLLARVEREEVVREFFAGFFKWEAGAVAAFSEGLLSAMVVREEHEGVELVGLQVDGLLPLPPPSPRVGIVDGMLVVSPFSSAVREAVSAIRGKLGRHAGRPLDVAVAAGAVELVFLDLPAWQREWQMLEERQRGESLLETLLENKQDSACALRVSRALPRLLGALGEASGVTNLDGENGFTFYMELKNQP